MKYGYDLQDLQSNLALAKLRSKLISSSLIRHEGIECKAIVNAVKLTTASRSHIDRTEDLFCQQYDLSIYAKLIGFKLQSNEDLRLIDINGDILQSMESDLNLKYHLNENEVIALIRGGFYNESKTVLDSLDAFNGLEFNFKGNIDAIYNEYEQEDGSILEVISAKPNISLYNLSADHDTSFKFLVDDFTTKLIDKRKQQELVKAKDEEYRKQLKESNLIQEVDFKKVADLTLNKETELNLEAILDDNDNKANDVEIDDKVNEIIENETIEDTNDLLDVPLNVDDTDNNKEVDEVSSITKEDVLADEFDELQF